MPRSRKPVEVLKKNGTYKNILHGHLKDTIKPETLKQIPEPKIEMCEDGLKEYYRLCKELIALDILADIDTSLVELAAYYWGVFVESDKYIKENYKSLAAYMDNRSQKDAGIYNTMNTAFKNYMDTGTKFGISPVARLNIRAPEKKGETEFEKFLLSATKK